MLKDRPLEVPEHCQQELTGREMQLGFFGRRLVSLQSPPFGFWLWWWTHVSSPVMMRLKKLSPDGCTAPTHYSICSGRCTYALLSDVQAPTLWKICGTQECHGQNNRLYLHWRPVVMRFILLLRPLVSARISFMPSSCFSSVADTVIGHGHLASITSVRTFLNISIPSYKL
jgi:hypothetical protein